MAFILASEIGPLLQRRSLHLLLPTALAQLVLARASRLGLSAVVAIPQHTMAIPFWEPLQ